MKFIFVKSGFAAAIALFFILVSSCNQSEKNGNQIQTEQHDEIHDHEAHDQENHSVDRLTLNNGAKWPADAPTNKNAKIIISIGDQFLENDNKNLQDYQTFGSDVNEAINTMIQECTMKGEADMALHFWFAPIMQSAHILKEASDTNELRNIALKMNDRMHSYHEYFE